jgi:DNA-binding beta-propeller fold protein YncE
MSQHTQQDHISKKRVVYEMSGFDAVTMRRDVEFRAADAGALTMDVYHPPDSTRGARIPAVVIVAGFPDGGFQAKLGCRFKEMASSVSWARLIAASGMAAITYTNREPAADLHALLQHVRLNAAAVGIDENRIGAWASSGNVPLALSVLMHDTGAHLKCAVLCYGFTLDLDGVTGVAEAARMWGFVNPGAGRSVDDLSRDIPLFIARAGQDQFPHLNESLDRFLAGALRCNLPVTFVNHPTAPHGACGLVRPVVCSRRRTGAKMGRQVLLLRRQTMAVSHRSRLTLLAGVAAIALAGGRTYTQGEVVDPAIKPLPNSHLTVIKSFGPLPDGRVWGSTAGVDIGPDGHVWAYDRCGTNRCEGSTLNPILKFDRTSGKVLAQFGGGQIVFPHGIHVDRDGNVWVTDGSGSKDGKMGHQVIKFSPEGKVLMRLGRAGVAAKGPDTFNEPCDVITAPNGDIFVSDGHSGQNPTAPPETVARIVKFSRDGKYIKEWGRLGSAPGEFRTPHALAFDSRGRLFVADRGNHRIQIFDQEGKFLEEWKQFSRISGLFITRDDMLYAIDSESSPERHPNWRTGVRIGTTKEDKVLQFIPPHFNGAPQGAAGEGVAVDPEGNVYAAEGPISRPSAAGGLTKYVKR